jgi:hypothetical protein
VLIRVDVVGSPMRNIDETFVSDNISMATNSRFGVGCSAFSPRRPVVQNSIKVIQILYFFSF